MKERMIGEYVITRTGLVHKSEYSSERDQIPSSYEISLCEEYIDKYMALTQKINFTPDGDSCHLKHVITTWYGKEVSNGAFIMAAIQKVG